MCFVDLLCCLVDILVYFHLIALFHWLYIYLYDKCMQHIAYYINLVLNFLCDVGIFAGFNSHSWNVFHFASALVAVSLLKDAFQSTAHKYACLP